MTEKSTGDKPKPFVQPVFDVGEPLIPGNWSVQAMADAEYDKEFVRKMDLARRK